MSLPPPPPALWAPRTRRRLQRFLTNMDRRKARQLAAEQQTAADLWWRAAYTSWWDEYGWIQGAPLPEQAFADMLRDRRAR